jgi:positive regulator of sigma E activity
VVEIVRTGEVVRCASGELAVRFANARCVGCSGCGRSIFAGQAATAAIDAYTLPLPQMSDAANSGSGSVGEGDAVRVRIAAGDLLRLCLLLFGAPLGLLIGGAALFTLGPLGLSTKILLGLALFGGWAVLLHRYRARLNVHICRLLQFDPVTSSVARPG